MENYKITKTIRFKLEADEKAIPAIMRDVSVRKKMGESVDIKNFVDELYELICDIREYLYLYDKNKGEYNIIKSGLTVKNTWLRDNAKDEIADQTLKRGLTIGDIKGKNSSGNDLQKNIWEIFNEVLDIQERLKSAVDSPFQKLPKRASIGLLLKGLAKKRALPYLVSLLENSNNRDEKDSASLIARKRAKTVMDRLERCILHYLPAQSHGLPVAKASFNYYTIYKKEIDYNGTVDKLKKRS